MGRKPTKTRAFSSAGLEHLPYKQRVGGSNPSTPTIPKTTIYVRTCKNQSCRCFLFYGKAYSLPYTEDAAYHLHIRQKWVSKNLVGIILVYFLPYIANTVLRNTTGYFSFHYRRYFRTPPLSCPITLSGTLPISSAMSTGRDDQALITSPCIFYPSVQRKPPLYFAQQNTGGRGGVTWPNNRQSVYNSSLNTIKSS